MRRKHAGQTTTYNKLSSLRRQGQRPIRKKPTSENEEVSDKGGSKRDNVKAKVVKSFKCDQCSASFVREDSLKCHLKNHKDSKLSTAYAFLKLQQPVIIPCARSEESPATNGTGDGDAMVTSDGPSSHGNNNVQHNDLIITPPVNVQPMTFSSAFSNISKIDKATETVVEDSSPQQNTPISVTVHDQSSVIQGQMQMTSPIQGSLLPSQVSLGINDILIAAGMSGLNSASTSPTNTSRHSSSSDQVDVGPAIVSTPHVSPGMVGSVLGQGSVVGPGSVVGQGSLVGQGSVLGQGPQVMQNISLPYIKLPNGQVLILTGSANTGQAGLTDHSVPSHVNINPSGTTEIQTKILALSSELRQEKIIQCAADSTTPVSSTQTFSLQTQDISTSQQPGAIPIQIILPNDQNSQDTLPLVSQLLNSVINRNTGENRNQTQSSHSTSPNAGTPSMQSFVLQIPAEAGPIKDGTGNIAESQSFVLQIPTSNFS